MECPKGCGAVITMADSDSELLKIRMENHVKEHHSLVTDPHVALLEEARTYLGRALDFVAGTDNQTENAVTEASTRDLHNKISAFLGLPLKEGTQNAVETHNSGITSSTTA
jgi:hypothetical protein